MIAFAKLKCAVILHHSDSVTITCYLKWVDHLEVFYHVDCVQPYKYHKLDADIATRLTLTKEDAVKYYTQMKIIRTMETAAGNLYKEKAIRGFCHLYSGQVSHTQCLI